MGNKKSLLELIFSGKTLSEIKSMSSEERQEFLKLKTLNSESTNVPKFSARTSFDITKPEQIDLKSLFSGVTKSVKSAPVKHQPIKSSVGMVKPESKNFRKSGSTQYTKSTTEQQKKSLKKSLNISVDNSSTDFISGTVDYSFPAGEGYGFDYDVYAIAQSSYGKIYVGGDFSEYYSYDDYIYSPYLVGLNSDGSINFDFDCSYLNGDVYAIAVQPDGKIIIGGNFTYYNYGPGYDCPYIARLNPDGSFDNTFAIGDGFDGDVFSLVIQPNGKILVGGGFSQYNSVDSKRIIRLNTNGSIDSTFQIGDSSVLFNNDVYTIKLQTDGKIIVGGIFSTFANISANYIVRLNSDGTRDTSFNMGNGFNNTVNSIDLQSDGKIIVGGEFWDTGSYNNNPCNGIVRLNIVGSLDSTFGFGVWGGVNSIKVQPDDKILVGGWFNSYMPFYNDFTQYSADELIRYNADCTFDYSFYYDELLNSNVYTIDLQSDGKILIGGDFDNDGNSSVYPLNYFGRLLNSVSTYKYTYAVRVECGAINKVYSVGSNILFTPDDDGRFISFKSSHDEVNYLCGALNISNGNEIYPYGNPGYVHLNTYDLYNCDSCQSEYYNYVEAYNPLADETENFLVDKKYKVGDFFHIEEIITGVNKTYKGCFQITIIYPYNYSIYNPINYVPYLTCEECVEANGVFYEAFSWDTMYSTIFESYQYLDLNQYPAVLIPNAPTNANIVVYSPWYVETNSEIIPSVYSTETFIDSGNPIPPTNAQKLIEKMGDGQLDFNFNGKFINNDNSGFDNYVREIRSQSDGKILVGGKFTSYNGNSYNKIIRLNSDGSIDNTFNVGTGFNGLVVSIEIQSDGKILVGGNFTSYDGNSSNRIIRLNSNGSIDNTFNIGSGFNGTVLSIAIQSNGKIIVGGGFTSYDGNSSNRIIRLNPDGSIDNTFNIGSGFNNGVTSIAIQPNGKILVVGDFSSYDGNTSNYIIRLNSDGSKDNTFNVGIIIDDIRSIVIQSDGKILIGGGFSYSIRRLNYDGSIDNTFNIGSSFDSYVFSIAIQPDGKILCGGYFTTYDGNTSNRIIRLNSDGTIDNTFNIGGGFNSYLWNISIQPNGKILCGGDFISYDGNTLGSIARLETNGSLDTTFNPPVGFNSDVLSIPIQSDGKILVGGNFTNYNGNTSNRIIRLNSDGSIDNTFNIGSGFNGTVFSIAIQSDGKILVGGVFTDYNGNESNRIIRLNSDGSIDNTFNVGSGFNGTVFSITIQSDGKILVGGGFTSYDGNTSNFIIRLNSDGSIDNTFNVGSGFDSYVYSIVVQSDGKILVGGTFNSYNGNESNRIIRLNSDGSIDNTFNIGSGFDNAVSSISIQSDGKILVGGYFTTYDGNTSNYIIRLNSDGTIDNTFNIGSGFDSYVLSISIQSDGKIIVGGGYTTYDGNTSYGIIRLNSDGSPDLKFLPIVLGDGTNSFVFNVNVLSDGNTLVSGYFDYYFSDKVGKIMKIFTNQDYKLTEFITCDKNEKKFLYVPFDTQTPSSLILTFDDIENAFSLVGDASNVNDWNTFFDLPTYGNPFTFVSVIGNNVELFGGSNITLRQHLFADDYLISMIDNANCVVGTELEVFTNFYTLQYNYNLVNLSLPVLTNMTSDGSILGGLLYCTNLVTAYLPSYSNIAPYSFYRCESLVNLTLDYNNITSIPDGEVFEFCSSIKEFNFPNATYIGSFAFDGTNAERYYLPSCTNLGGSVLDNGVWAESPNITAELIIPAALMTCNSGNPDGDIQYLIDNHNVTIITGVTPVNLRYNSPTLTQTPELILKGVVNTTEAVCGTVLVDVDNTSFISGSNKFNGDDSLVITNSSDGLYPRTQDFTIEWFQKRSNNGQNSRPFSLGSYAVEVTISVSFEGGTDFYLWLNDNNWNFGNLNDYNTDYWSHFAITRNNNIIRVFYNGNEIFNQNDGKPILFMGDLNNSNNDDITIGNEFNASSVAQFGGVITNFRWTLGTAVYTSNFEVPRNPLKVLPGTKVLMLSPTEVYLLTNFADSYYEIQQTEWDGGPTDFDAKNPFDNSFELFKNDGTTSYPSCTSCLDTFMYKSIMYVRDGVHTPWIERHSIKPYVIDDYKTKGPIFTLRAPECYEILNYFY